MKSKFFSTVVSIFTFFIVAGFCRAESDHWVGTWGTSPQLTEAKNLPPPPGLGGNTLRQVVHVSIGGKKLRVRFSNAFGNDPVTLGAADIAMSSGGSAIKTESGRPLTFRGQPSVTIPPGELCLSDPLNFDMAPLSDIAVTVHFNETSRRVTGHIASHATSYLQAGDAVSAPGLPTATNTQHWYLLTGIDVAAESSSATIVAFGDSITDGSASTLDKNKRWPDDLANRLQTNETTKNLAVLNEGIGGNCILQGGVGPTAVSRFERDVLNQSSVRWLILLEGVNDIGRSHATNSLIAQDLIAAYQNFIDQAHAKNIRVFGATILPFDHSQYGSPTHEAARLTVNDWIRSSGKFDAVIDFDAATRDPQNPSHLLPAADSGDHLHPSVKGYEIMAAAINLKLFDK